MKKVYLTADGRTFDTESEAEKHEEKLVYCYKVNYHPELTEGRGTFHSEYVVELLTKGRLSESDALLLMQDYLNKEHGLVSYIQGTVPTPGYLLQRIGSSNILTDVVLEFRGNEKGLVEIGG